MEDVGIFYDHLEYFTSIWYNLWPFGTVCGPLVHFFPIIIVRTKKNLATLVPTLNDAMEFVWNCLHC
jgi:hypothetical protein